MSDTQQRPDWWVASDGKWYPPEQHPNYQAGSPAQSAATPADPMVTQAPPPGWWQGTDGQWYPPQANQPQGPKKKFYKRVWFWLLVVFALGISGCISIVSLASVAVDKANTKVHTVIYSVTGSGTATITYDAIDNGNNGTTQNSDITLPWSKTIKGSGLFNAYTVTATLGENGGSAACTITVDGKQVSSNNATGAFATASCTGSAP